MKKTLNIFWIISAIFLAVGALWGMVSSLADVMGQDTICGIALIIFGVISVLAFFTMGAKSSGSGWILFDGFTSFFCGLAFVFWYVDATLFNVNLVYIVSLWLMFLGVSQIARSSGGSKSFGKFATTGTGVLAVCGGLSLYVKPVSDLLLISEAMKLCGYRVTFMLLLAAVLVISRCLDK